MRTGKISKRDAWVTLTSTIWSILSYPLPSFNLTKKQCQYIMSPGMNYIRPALGICRSFPRTVVFSPNKYLGIGIKHLYMVQEIACLKDIMLHTYKDMTTGCLYRNTTELLLLELGMTIPLHSLPFNSYSPLATNSLVKSIWCFLYENNLELRHDINILPQRLNDQVLMEVFWEKVVGQEDLLSINKMSVIPSCISSV